MYKNMSLQSNKSKESGSEKYFSSNLNFYKIFWLFMIFSIIGFIIETIWCIFRYGEIQSRQGLIYGPFSQVYGFGAIILIMLLNQVKSKNRISIFMYSMIIGSIFEYSCSFVQQMLLGSISWHYSTTLSIFNGRTSIVYSVFWGILGYVLIQYLYPFCSKIIDKMPCRLGIRVTWIMILFMIFDFTISGAAVYRQNQRINNIPATSYMQQFLDKNYSDSYLEKIYPNMIFKS
ncbi:MAG: putative ABC transporter permease [Peptostreptococcaceae bacterium]